jgi:hypothetical protein
LAFGPDFDGLGFAMPWHAIPSKAAKQSIANWGLLLKRVMPSV